METIQFDSGVKEYRINGEGILRLHPGDPNLYVRFQEAVEKIAQMEAKVREDEGEDLLERMRDIDRQLKQLLSWVFGQENDFDALLGGVNLLAVTENGQRVITNFLQALEPVLVEGAKRCARQVTQAARDQAKARKEAQ